MRSFYASTFAINFKWEAMITKLKKNTYFGAFLFLPHHLLITQLKKKTYLTRIENCFLPLMQEHSHGRTPI